MTDKYKHKNETPCSISKSLFNHFQYTEINCTEAHGKRGKKEKRQCSGEKGITFSPRLLSEKQHFQGGITQTQKLQKQNYKMV